MATSNDTQRILKLGIDEMFEDLTYNVAYNEVLTKLKANSMEDGALKDAINSGINIMFSSALMLYISKQEKFIDTIITSVWSAVSVCILALRNQAKSLFRKFFKGRKATMFSKIFDTSTSDRIGYSQLAISGGSMIMQSSQSSSDFYNRSSAIFQQKQILLQTKDQQLNYAKAKVDSINQTLLFKLFTSKFTEKDKELLRKITGSSNIDVEQINKVASFMFVTDSNGNITGLSEQFMSMLNGLGYLSGKERG